MAASIGPFMIINKKVLVADDEPTDVFLLQRAFAKARVTISLHVVRDGWTAIAYLKGEAPYSDRNAHPLPDLMLLDLKMPGLNGFEVLTWLRKQPGLKRLPVIVLTSSNLASDINRAYEMGANSYLVKPHEPAEMSQA